MNSGFPVIRCSKSRGIGGVRQPRGAGLRVALVLGLALSLGYVLTRDVLAQANARRTSISATTPLGPDYLTPVGLKGEEGISSLFRFQLDLVASSQREIPFDALLGKNVLITLTLPGRPVRYVSGICSRFSQGDRERGLTHYQMEVVPSLWLLTRQSQSRVFEQKAIPEILTEVLQQHGIRAEVKLDGTFHPRDSVVQYRETDFAFVSRLMEEEGIFYFFKHNADGHQLVLANSAKGHPRVPPPSALAYEPWATPANNRGSIYEWTKTQELRAGKYTLRDYSFESPNSNLQASSLAQDQVQIGQVLHRLKSPVNSNLEIYDWPGEYAKRFDGIDAAGNERPEELTKLSVDNLRLVQARMEAETVQGVKLRGASTCANFVPGHAFTFEKHYNADGEYVLTSVQHAAEMTPGQDSSFDYQNTFTCIPAGLPYRPQRVTPKPLIAGTQTAIVVGPRGTAQSGDQPTVFTDKYGRVKVRFLWDRREAARPSSCWVRVGALNAGLEREPLLVPQIGQEVVVAFLEGDPDQPIIVGSVFNGTHLPPQD